VNPPKFRSLKMIENANLSVLKEAYEDSFTVFESLNKQIRTWNPRMGSEVLNYFQAKQKIAFTICREKLDAYLKAIADARKNPVNSKAKAPIPLKKEIEQLMRTLWQKLEQFNKLQ